MTPPAAAAAAPRTRTRRAAPAPRRVSGPGRRPTPQGGPPKLVVRLGGAVHTIAEHRWLERLIRGNAWIAIVGIGLIGIVFMQVSMLRMNAGIGRSVERASVLERENSAMRAQISELSSTERLAAEASKLGLVLRAGTPRFLDAREASARRALAAMTAPGVGIIALQPSEAPSQVPTTSTTPTLADTSVAPTTSTQLAPDSTTPTPTPTTQEPVVQPETTTPQTAAPATTAPTTQTQSQPTTQTQQPAAQQAATPTSTGTAPPDNTGGATADGAAR